MLTKAKVQELISHMPESFSVDELVEKVFLLQKIEIGKQQIKEGDSFTEDEMDNIVDSWH